jgi:hypothetical protein
MSSVARPLAVARGGHSKLGRYATGEHGDDPIGQLRHRSPRCVVGRESEKHRDALSEKASRCVVGPQQGMGAAPAGSRSAVGGAAQLLWGHQRALSPDMSRLPAGLPPGRRCGRLALQADGIRRRGLGGVGGIEPEPGLEVRDPLVQLSDPAPERLEDGHEGRLRVRRYGIPEGFRDRKRGAHPQRLRPDCTEGSAHERLHEILSI